MMCMHSLVVAVLQCLLLAQIMAKILFSMIKRLGLILRLTKLEMAILKSKQMFDHSFESSLRVVQPLCTIFYFNPSFLPSLSWLDF